MAFTMTNSRRAREFRELRQRQSQKVAQTQTETAAQKIEPDEMRRQPVSKPSQIPADEAVEPKIKPRRIIPEVPKPSRGYRP
jgi:crotonobetainyl-CoA:carnitine CoA-transferase CaiB-like acyl-CoA transferase